MLQLDVPAFKIASFENNHLPLIRKVAATGKPMIISTGMASLADLKRPWRQPVPQVTGSGAAEMH